MRQTDILAAVLAAALGVGVTAAATAGGIGLEFGSSDPVATGDATGSHLGLYAETPVGEDFSVGIGSSSDKYTAGYERMSTQGLGLMPSWKVSSSLRLSAFYEDMQRDSPVTSEDTTAWGVEAGFSPTDPVKISAYAGRYDDTDPALAGGTSVGLSLRSVLGARSSGYVFLQQDDAGTGRWEARGIGLHRLLRDRRLGLTMLYSEQDGPLTAGPEQRLYFGGTIAVGATASSAPEFRSRHCVACQRPF